MLIWTHEAEVILLKPLMYCAMYYLFIYFLNLIYDHFLFYLLTMTSNISALCEEELETIQSRLGAVGDYYSPSTEQQHS